MTVNDILEKIKKLDEIRSSLKDIYYECHELTSSDSDAVYDAYAAIGEYIDELKQKEVKE